MTTDISPDKQSVDNVFSGTDYYIDFYQREYKWKEDQVETLLDDFFHVFNPSYEDFSDRSPDLETIAEFPWYYLSTYVTNEAQGKTYVVDGQQRLTTLSLIMIKLHKLARRHDLDDKENWIQERILGHGPSGKNFWIGHGKREKPMRAIYTGAIDEIDTSRDVTARNMIDNFDVVSDYMEEELGSDHRLEMFVLFFLRRIVMIRLGVKQRTDVPMVFEVINDRGVSLQPHEILKGKLLAQIDRAEVGGYNKTWEKVVGELDYNDEANDFFVTYLRSRFADTRSEGQKLGGDYHRLMYEAPYDNELELRATTNVKDFVQAEMPYYARLFRRVQRLAGDYNSDYPHVRYNGLTGMDSQDMLILAGCDRNDGRESEKIKLLSGELDRLFVLLRLNKAYDSNTFADSMYDVRAQLPDAPPEAYREIFDGILYEQVKESRGVEISEPLPYRFFAQVGYEDLQRRFLRYFFTRVEEFIADGIGKNLPDDRYNLVRNSGSKNGYHIEHVLAHNEENRRHFGGDEEVFERERQRLGALLLLNNRDNLSSGNEVFEGKKKTYAVTLYWNQTLRDDFAKSKPNHKEFLEKYGLTLAVEGPFDQEAIDKRTRALHSIARELWC